ncbi:MAG: TetR/AcrR family transcriptional regulator [Gammaproteobacteria bacterium]|nr:TetR/AcrR family transcriptional regulator [Gammaproteobacteria bacterium]
MSPIKKTENNYWWRALSENVAPMDTRESILFAAYQEMHLNGFQSTSLSQILNRAGVTKGALYHHFKNKSELGYAVIEEIIAQRILQDFYEPLNQIENPIDGLIALIQGAGDSFTLMDVQLGCPLNNLSQELAPVDEVFRLKLNSIYQQWVQFVTNKLLQGQDNGFVKKEIDCEQMAVLVVATLEGCLSAAKVSQSLDTLMQCGGGLIQHLNFIRA